MKSNSYFYNIVVCGGTFDHFHKGHKEFILFQLQKSKNVLIGITTDRYIVRYKNEKGIQSYRVRRKTLQDFLKKEHVLDRIKIAPIDTLYIPARWENIPIDAIVVSDDTYGGALLVNEKRKLQFRKELPIIICKGEKAQDGMLISSTRIREGKINREGRLYLNPQWFQNKLFLTKEARKQCKKPFGKIIQTFNPPNSFSCFATVGDVTTKVFNENKLFADIAVIDFNVGRQKVFFHLSDLQFRGGEIVTVVKNPPSTLTPLLFNAVVEAFNEVKREKRIVLRIEGEEDLSVLPLLLLAPLDFTIFYGQPGKGMVKIKVTEKNKEKAYSIIKSFNISLDGERSQY